MNAQVATSVQPSRRVLTVWDLIIYGIVLIQPIAPVGVFGLASKISRGHAVTTILVAMVAMMCTALSYGRMAALYPAAGSAYTYVGRAFNSQIGFLVGWAMFLDYLIIPIINTIYAALTLQRLVPQVPYAVWVTALTCAMTLLNLRGVSSMARVNKWLLSVMTVVIGAFVVLAVRYLFGSQGWGGLLSTTPLYNPQTFDVRSIMTGTSLAALTYIGFDGVTTLAEEVERPRRTVPLATVLVCLLTGAFSAVEVYLAQRVWPDYNTFRNLETAFMDVTRRVGGEALFQAMGLVLIVACLGSGLTGQAGAARLMYGMGRDDVLPKRIFGHLDAKRNDPSWNIWFIGICAFAGSLLLSYERTAELLNFGAFLAFMGVNLSAIRTFCFRREPGRKVGLLSDAVVPALGFLFCLAIWWNLPIPAKIGGGVWLTVGVTYVAIKTRGFRETFKTVDFKEV
jgi:amino acid transporter